MDSEALTILNNIFYTLTGISKFIQIGFYFVCTLIIIYFSELEGRLWMLY